MTDQLIADIPADPSAVVGRGSPNVEWIDLLDPDEATLRQAWAGSLQSHAIDHLVDPTVHDDEPRPKLESHGDYAFGVLLVPVVVADENRVYYQEVDLVVTTSLLLTVRKTPAQGLPIDLAVIHDMGRKGLSAGMLAYRIVDHVAEGFLDLVDGLQGEIDELEDHLEDWPSKDVRDRLKGLRHDVLRNRRMMAPTRDAIHQVIDNRIELDGGELFPHEVELRLGDAYDKLLRASEGLLAASELLSGVRDYYQSKVANDQNDVMKRFTVIASLLLVPTFIVGLYGQNFDQMKELHWAHGYGFSWALILGTTLAQLWYYHRKHYI
ncbi:MAG: magnesium transporter [Actinomycetota bacterium]|jgi:magnesium transporter|nr:magnesium transporter [Actinomycetota bacterium]